MIPWLRPPSATLRRARFQFTVRPAERIAQNNLAPGLSSGKQLVAQFEGIHQRVDLFACVVHGEGCAAGGWQSQMIYQRARAMMACAHRQQLAGLPC